MDYDHIVKLSFEHPALLYDGLCPFCHFMVRYVAVRDRNDIFRFASLQSINHGEVPALKQDSVVLISEGKACIRSAAVMKVLRLLAGIHVIPATVLSIIPKLLADRIYDIIARNRKKWFGTYASCPLPPTEIARKFIALVP